MIGSHWFSLRQSLCLQYSAVTNGLVAGTRSIGRTRDRPYIQGEKRSFKESCCLKALNDLILVSMAVVQVRAIAPIHSIGKHLSPKLATLEVSGDLRFLWLGPCGAVANSHV
jgi:hypothetical protein